MSSCAALALAGVRVMSSRCGKIPHGARESAESHAAELRAKFPREAITPYFHRLCGSWHVGHEAFPTITPAAPPAPAPRCSPEETATLAGTVLWVSPPTSRHLGRSRGNDHRARLWLLQDEPVPDGCRLVLARARGRPRVSQLVALRPGQRVVLAGRLREEGGCRRLDVRETV